MALTGGPPTRWMRSATAALRLGWQIRSSWLADRSPASTSQMANAKCPSGGGRVGQGGTDASTGLLAQGQFLVGEAGTEQRGGHERLPGLWAGGCRSLKAQRRGPSPVKLQAT